MRKFEEIIDSLLTKYRGGEEYFDNLDAELRKPENLDIVKTMMSGITNLVVSTGKFGLYLKELQRDNIINFPQGLIVFNGGIRTGNNPTICHFDMPYHVETNIYTFVDDSFYSGGTRDKIASYLKNYYDTNLVQTIVAYDGSINNDTTVLSLYKYYKQ